MDRVRGRSQLAGPGNKKMVQKPEAVRGGVPLEEAMAEVCWAHTGWGIMPPLCFSLHSTPTSGSEYLWPGCTLNAASGCPLIPTVVTQTCLAKRMDNAEVA